VEELARAAKLEKGSPRIWVTSQRGARVVSSKSIKDVLITLGNGAFEGLDSS